ncbi:DNA polymerase sliding clamp subunit B [Staphylothermus marinus F1]|uniref:DNA polymerase sliding clamp n=1 Tax=Staphylothermus marinus (strain ATCC 43588 / DSM 3639 / JCM 9404 / F1) TaxID=399550 RepID=A3DN90_STAMF|nr:DNA polymerase sliding clamp [Staphylothermus marinus]ABN70100.1 DNA polymerase sliding clamp subunit B [Staphylothermus marinus F1]
MFRASYTATSKFKYIAQTIAKITDEAPFYATQDALEVRVLSPDKTTLTIVKIPSIAFEEYEVDGEKYFVIGADELNKIVKRGTRNDILVFELDEEKNQLKIIFRNKKTGIERSFVIETKPRTLEKIPEPQIDLGVTARFVADDYKHIIRDLKIIGEEAVLHYKEGKLYIYSHAEQKEYRGEFSEGNPLTYLSATIDEARAKYSVGLLEATLKPIQAAKFVTVSFDRDKPVKIEFEITEGGYIVYWIVPRIEA